MKNKLNKYKSQCINKIQFIKKIKRKFNLFYQIPGFIAL